MNPSDGAIIPVLFLVTLLVAIGIGLWQYRRARKAKEEHKRSSLGNTTGRPAASASGAEQRPGERLG